MTKRIEVLDAAEMLRMLSQGLKAQAARPNLHAYMPHTKQKVFHKSTKKKKLYIGGNRSGKTVGGIVEDIYWLKGEHPYRKVPEAPIRGRIVGVDFLNGISKIILPELQRWIPPSLLKNGSWEDSYSKELRTLKLANGSFVELMSYDQETDKFAGTSRHFCVDQDVKILSKRGWLLYSEMSIDDEILTVNPVTLQNEWSPVKYIYRGVESNSLLRVRSRNNFDVKVTPDHRWLVSNKKTGKVYFNTTEKLKKSEQLIMHGSTIEQVTEIYSDAFVALVGWVVTDGSLNNTNQITITQSWTANLSKCEDIELLLKGVGADYREYNYRSSVSVFYVRGEIALALRKVVTNTRGLTPEFLLSLSTRQLQILLASILDGDGCRLNSGKIMIADSLRYPEHMDMYCMLISMLGRRATYSVGEGSNSYQLMSKSNVSSRYDYSKVSVDSLDISEEKYDGIVWCPSTDNGTFYGMRNGSVFLTGNTHFDEEPPQHIFNECNARLIDTGGSYWMTMTPVEGMTWIYDTIFLKGTEEVSSGIEVIVVDMLENPYIDSVAAEEFLSGLSAEERAAREHGQFVQMGGRVFKNFSRSSHTIPSMVPPKNWEWYLSLDHGFNNPTAALWHAVSPDGSVITFAEHYESEMVIDEHAKAIHARNAALGKIPDIMVADPAIAQRQGVTGVSIQGEYADRGIFLSLGNNDVQVGIARMAQYLRENPKTGKPFWLITEDCPNLISELLKLRWKTYSSRKMQFENNKQEKIHKKDDHASDSTRYFFSFLPDLTPVDFGTAKPEETFGFPSVIGRDPSKNLTDTWMNKMFIPAETKWKTTESSDIGGLEYE